eukprot:SAG22_NODE_19466_length_274_cov_1.188571_2_plen_58_part_01
MAEKEAEEERERIEAEEALAEQLVEEEEAARLAEEEDLASNICRKAMISSRRSFKFAT